VQDSLSLRSGQEGDDMRRDSVERDEKRLAELGRKTVEMYVISHVLCERLEVRSSPAAPGGLEGIGDRVSRALQACIWMQRGVGRC
jgi:hypothetical protein